MAITNRGTIVLAPDEQVPSGYTRPTESGIIFSDYEYVQKGIVLDVAKATVENATANTTMGNIIGNASIGVTKQVTDKVTADYISSNTVTCYAAITKIEDNSTPQSTGNFFKNAAATYKVTVDIFIKTA